jgi:hypothetical protein
MSDDIDSAYLDEINDLTRLIESGEAMVRDGSAIDLSNLEAAVANLCQRMAEDPPKDTDAVTDAIAHLVTRLNALGEALREQAENRQ